VIDKEETEKAALPAGMTTVSEMLTILMIESPDGRGATG
jgi:hypothetical protein